MADDIGAAIRKTADRKGLSVEAFRVKNNLPNTGFWRLLKNLLPAKVETRKMWKRRLERAGVRVNGSL